MRRRSVKLLICLTLAFAICFMLVACSGSEGAASSSNGSSSSKTAVIYQNDKKIDAFVKAFNEAYPSLALATENLEPYYHHGRTHEDQIKTSIDGMPVIISSEGITGPFNVSVYYAAYQTSNDKAESNHRLFALVMPVFNPGLSAEDVENRWREVLDDRTNTVKWDDGIEFLPDAGTHPNGDFGYMKICA